MSSIYTAIADEFEGQLYSLCELVGCSQSKSLMASTRVASVRATTLLLAATFEEFVREMALEYANLVVSRAKSLEQVPDRLVDAAWKQTLQDLLRARPMGETKQSRLASTAKLARPRVNAILSFMEGDLSQDIYTNLTHNENNMRPEQIDRLFRIGGLPNVCRAVCKRGKLQTFFGVRGQERTHAALKETLNEFITKRNEIAHSLNLVSSDAPDAVFRDIDLLRAFAIDLRVTLTEESPVTSRSQ